MNVGFTVKNTTQEPIDFLATTKPYVGSYPLFTGKSQLKNGLEKMSSTFALSLLSENILHVNQSSPFQSFGKGSSFFLDNTYK